MREVMKERFELIGNKVKELRKRGNLSQEGLANEIHVADETIWRIEKAKSVMSLSIAIKLAEYFGVSVSELACDDYFAVDEFF